MAATAPRVARATDLPSQGYRIRVNADGVSVDAADGAGEFYALQTLAQLRGTAADAGSLPLCEVEDWPDIEVRGVMIDISRDKVPTMATLFALVDRLAGWKVNELQLYTEHTFAYSGHEDVWAAASPMTPEEIEQLDGYCAARHVTLTPNQNCLGHMERWLRFPRYRSLALVDAPFTLGGIMTRPPMTMDPADPSAFELARELLGQVVPHFRHSGRVNVGLDEPFELAEERYREYAAYLRALRALPELDGKEMLVWGDILTGHPELLDELPDGVTVAEWGYEATHPFDERLARLAADGRARWVCPGTSSWSSLFGRTTNMRDNQRAAAGAAMTHGASGWLNTDWGDGGHLQYLPVSEPGFAHGAAVSWCAETNRDIDVAADNELYAALLALGDVHRHSERQVPNNAAFLLPLWLPHLRRALVTDDEFEAIDDGLVDARRAIERAAMNRDDADLIRREMGNSIELAQVIVEDGRARNGGDGSLAGITGPARHALADRLEPVIATHRDMWHARNRPGGFGDSVSWLERLRDSYRAGGVAPGWLPPGLRAVTR